MGESEKPKKKLSFRTGQRLQRNSYDLHELACRLRADGHERWADAVNSMAREMGKVGRAMEDEADGRHSHTAGGCS